MARFLYISDQDGAQARATQLGCGWMQAVPPEFQSVATAPCAIVAGAGTATVLPEPTTAAAVAQAAAPILAAEKAANDAAAAQAANGATLTANAVAAIQGNITFLAIASPTAAQVATQVKALTRQVDALIRLAANQLDSTQGT